MLNRSTPGGPQSSKIRFIEEERGCGLIPLVSVAINGDSQESDDEELLSNDTHIYRLQKEDVLEGCRRRFYDVRVFFRVFLVNADRDDLRRVAGGSSAPSVFCSFSLWSVLSYIKPMSEASPGRTSTWGMALRPVRPRRLMPCSRRLCKRLDRESRRGVEILSGSNRWLGTRQSHDTARQGATEDSAPGSKHPGRMSGANSSTAARMKATCEPHGIQR